jgi:RNA-directed DNA polymerase
MRITLGDLAICRRKKKWQLCWQQHERDCEKSAEAIVAEKKREGLNLLTTRNNLMQSNEYGATAKVMARNMSHDVTGEGETVPGAPEELQISVATQEEQTLKIMNLMPSICSDENIERAYRRVYANKGAPGVDGMTVYQLKDWLSQNKGKLIRWLIGGTYKPQPVRKVEIPKPNGGMRQLGIPTVIDRLVQQAIAQVLIPIFDPHFSTSSYGFRPGIGAHQALEKSREYVQSGKQFVVDIDLEKFFDRVNHDILMNRIGRRIGDKCLLKCIGNFLRSGIMDNGICEIQTEGTPQGGPLSPILSNILLDDLDKELERRGHTFCRYADDCNVYVGSRKSGERVMATLVEFLEKKLRLRVNREKSAVSPSRSTKVPGSPDLVEWMPDDSEVEY